jgi:hypothetical protein
MMHPVKKWRFAWTVMVGVFLLTIGMSLCIDHHAWAREGIIDGSNPADFEGVGHIDSLKDDLIVINDMQKKLSRNATFYKQGRIQTKRSSFSVGAKVGYITNSKGEIISLWLLR